MARSTGAVARVVVLPTPLVERRLAERPARLVEPRS